jgi:hypothetical protein
MHTKHVCLPARIILYQFLVTKMARATRTTQEKSCGLVPMERQGEVRRVAMKDGLTALQERHLQVKVLQDFDERAFQSRDFQAILDATNDSNRVDFGADVFEQTSNES